MMKILWVCGVELPFISKALNKKVNNAGGWLSGIFENLKKDKSNSISICYQNVDVKEFSVDGTNCYTFSQGNIYKENVNVKNRIKEVILKEKPDLIHSFGTEFYFTLATVEIAEQLGILDKVVINTQGIISECGKHYFALLDKKVIKRNTLRDLLKHDNILNQSRKFLLRGKFEIKAFKLAKNVIGRTEWDEAIVKGINPYINYYFCNETLRGAFYNGKWNYDSCEKHSVFFSQCSYPLKGFHLMVEAFSKIKLKYTDAKLYVTGEDLFRHLSLKEKLKQTYYSKYLKNLINKYNLKDSVVFLGNCSEEQMRDNYLRANVFVLSSSLENSPNSLGEAMLLGVPSVASDVGGVKNFIRHGENGFLFPLDEPNMIAYYVDKIFSDKILAEELSSNANSFASRVFNKDINQVALSKIYSNLVGNK